jgi:hypothetical protein
VSLIDESARRRFEAGWRSGQPEPIECFLPAQDDPPYLPTLEELVAIELELRWQAAAQPDAVDSAANTMSTHRGSRSTWRASPGSRRSTRTGNGLVSVCPVSGIVFLN